RRFANLAWAILTPERCVRWDGAQLQFGPGASVADAPPADAGEALWLTYYQSIFNPARLKLQTMLREMPRRYWPLLPEAQLIPSLSAQAATRSAAMLACPPTLPARRLPDSGMPRVASAPPPAASPMAEVPTGVAPRRRAWEAEREAARHCRE